MKKREREVVMTTEEARRVVADLPEHAEKLGEALLDGVSVLSTSGASGALVAVWIEKEKAD